MRFLLVGTSLSALALAVSVPVSAQDVVMRRPLPISNQSGNAGWQTSEFRPVDSSGNPVLPQNACGLYTERRDVWCDNDKGERVDEYFCSSEPKPADNRPQFHDSGCSYSWDQTAWNDPGDSCTLTETQTRSVTCRRDLDNAVVNDDKCSASKPSSTQIVPDFSTCSHSWKTDAFADNGPSCVLAEVQNRNVWCERDLDGTTVSDGMCDAGVRPAASQTVEDIRSCTHDWAAGSWVDPGNSCSGAETQTRNVECKRDLDGAVVADAQCNAGTRPSASQQVEDYSSCSYSAVNPGAWTYASTCSANTTRTRDLECRRSDGTIVADTECTSRSISLTETENTSNYSSCTNSWETNAWIDPGASCTANETQTRSVWCKRDLDGASQADAACDAGSRPAASQTNADYSGCSYTAVNWTGYTPASTCSANTTQTRTAQCRRGDGTIVANSECTSRGVALSETQTGIENYSTCKNSWVAAAYVDPGASCTATETQTRSVTCRRDLDQALMSDASCTGTRPGSTQTVVDYSGCGYAAVNWTGYTPASTCSANTTQTRTAQCRRSDGTIVANSECTSRSIALSETQTGIQNYTTCTNSWTTGSYVDPGASCTAAETQTRAVWCRRDLDQAVMPDASCTATRPGATQTVIDYSGCGYAAINWTAWNYGSTCSASTTRSRTADCRRSDGTIVADSQCTTRGIALSESESGVSNLTSCGYTAANWSAWNYGSTCSANTTRTQTAQCRRSDGVIVTGTECTSRGISLSNTESGVSNLTTCGYSAVNPSAWSYASSCSSNTSRTQTYQCQRSDGTIVANTECTSRSISLTSTQNGVSNYAGCSYNGSSSQSSCSNGYRNVDYTCTRSDGVVVANSSCGLPTGTQQAACSSYSWQSGGWSGWSACAGGTQSQTRSVICQEKTGAATSTVSDSFCGGGKPADSQSQSCTMPTITTPVVFNYKTGNGCSGTSLRSVTWNGERETFGGGEYMSASTPASVREQRGVQILANGLKANGESLTCVDYLARSSPRSGVYSFTWTAFSGTPLPDGANPIRYVTVDW